MAKLLKHVGRHSGEGVHAGLSGPIKPSATHFQSPHHSAERSRDVHVDLVVSSEVTFPCLAHEPFQRELTPSQN